MTFIASHWPYSQKMLVPALQEAFKTNVTIQHFHRFYFPHPGCEVESLVLGRFEHSTGPQGLVTVQKMTMTGRYSDLLFRPYHFADIRLDGLHVRIPPQSGHGTSGNHPSDEDLQPSKVSIGLVTANGSVLEFTNENGDAPLRFEIHKLRVQSISAGKPMSYQVNMSMSKPSGELESTGTFGPWQSAQIGKIPLNGSVKLTGAKLDKYDGIGGTLQSAETFSGTLDQAQVIGEATVPDFHLKWPGHPIQLFSQFEVMVNALEGEARLRDVTAKLGQTTLHVQGGIIKSPRLKHRETSLDFTILRGRAEDFLWLFNSASKPPMLGNLTSSGHILVPKFGAGFLEELVLNGRFEVRDGHFQRETQLKTNELSARAQGKKIKDATEAPEVAVASLASDVTIERDVAHFSRLYFEVPGARARVQGTYDLKTHQVDLRGNLWTDASVSEDTSGVKAILLKPVDPLFRRKHAGAMVAVVMDGDIDQPHFGTELTKKKTAWQNSK